MTAIVTKMTTVILVAIVTNTTIVIIIVVIVSMVVVTLTSLRGSAVIMSTSWTFLSFVVYAGLLKDANRLQSPSRRGTLKGVP